MLWRDDHKNALNSVWLVVFALIRTLSAGLEINRPVRPSGFLRALFVGFWLFEVVLCLVEGRPYKSVLTTTLLLFAEYAATIVTIPPKPKREAKLSLSRSTVA